MKTHCVRADSSQALTSDIRSFVFLTDSSESQGSHIPYLLCILFVKSSWIFLLFRTAEVPFAIPHKRKNQGNFTGEYYTVLTFGSDGCSCDEKADGLSRSESSQCPFLIISAFPKGASNRWYPAVFCAHPVSSIPDNFKIQKKKKTELFWQQLPGFKASVLPSRITFSLRR